MLDIKWIRENAAAFDAALVNRGKAPLSVEVLALDEKRRAHLTRLQELQAQANASAKAIGAKPIAARSAPQLGGDLHAVLRQFGLEDHA